MLQIVERIKIKKRKTHRGRRQDVVKKVLIVICILLFLFAVIRISTSTYENYVRAQKEDSVKITERKIEG